MRRMFNVYDSKTEAYLDPMTALNKGEALRLMQRLVDDPEHIFCKSPEDFTLFEIGTYDQFTGVAKIYDARISIANLVELKKTNHQTRPAQPDLAEPIRSVN